MKRTLRILRPLVILAIFAGAAWLLYHQLKDLPFDELVEDLKRTRASQIVLAIGLTALNYVILLGYDWLAIRYLRHPLSLLKLAVASFIGHVSSFNLGSLAGGSSMRYRIYSAWNFSVLEIVQLVAILGLTFWLGVLALAGIVFLVAPFPIPESILHHLPDWARHHLPWHDVRFLGVILLFHVVGYLGLCAVWRKPFRVLGREIPLPPPSLSLGQIAVSCADLMVGAAVFYVLLPPELTVGYVRFLGVFLLGLVVQVFLHVPAGLGVFDVVMLAFFPPDQMAAPLLVFRGVYYLLPLAVAGVVLVILEITLGRQFLRELRGKPCPAPATDPAGSASSDPH